jgi:hypothetical protein
MKQNFDQEFLIASKRLFSNVPSNALSNELKNQIDYLTMLL